jgi:hypothetical protein
VVVGSNPTTPPNCFTRNNDKQQINNILKQQLWRKPQKQQTKK